MTLDQPRPRPTLRDVAALAGVSVKTASRVVSGESGVVAAKVEAVRRAVEQLDYRRDLHASSLRRADGRSAAVAAIFEDLANHFSAEVHRALEDVAREHGTLILAGSLDESPERERDLVRAFIDRRVDAIVIAPASDHQGYLQREVPTSTPVVFVDRAPHGWDTDAVVTDNAAASAGVVRHLAASGHRRVAFLGDLMTITTAADRYSGYRDGMAELELAPRSDYVATGLHDEQSAEAAVRAMFDLEQPPTALFTAQNNITVVAIRTLQALGLENRVALVGFDDFPLADLVRPGITVMAQDPTAIGRHAGEIAFARMSGDRSPPRTTVVPTRLVVRGSGEIPPQ
jgi:LacI family transcriptional regulator